MKKIICVVGVIILFWGCTKTKEKIVEVEKPVPVDAWAIAWLTWYSYQDVYLYSDPIEDTDKCDVTLKWGINQVNFEKKRKYPDYLYLWCDTIQCESGTFYTLELSSQTFGRCSGNIKFPEEALITQPNYEDTLPIGDVEIKWSSENASFYAIWINISAYDSIGHLISVQYVDTFLTTNTYIIDSSHFDIPNAVYYQVDMEVIPYSGSLYHANMSGDFKGYLFGEGEWDEIFFYVGAPVGISTSALSSKPSFLKPPTYQRIQKIRKIIAQLVERE